MVGAHGIRFDVTLQRIDASVIARLPKQVSDRLPSRGQVAVSATIDGHAFTTVLEPDGEKGHWLRVDDDLRHAAAVGAGDRVDVGLEVRRDWPEPELPADLAAALAAAPTPVQDLWTDLTPMARWEWVRWVGATANPVTRQRRVEVSLSKLSAGKRRPCCFDLSACTDPAVSRGGRLRSPA